MPTVMVRVTSIDEHLQNGEPMDILVQLVQPSPPPLPSQTSLRRAFPDEPLDNDALQKATGGLYSAYSTR